MVLPLALAQDDVCYCFLLLLLYATLPCFNRHWVQTALSAISLFDVYNRFAVNSVTAVTMAHVMTTVRALSPSLWLHVHRHRRVWDPGKKFCVDSQDSVTMASTMASLVSLRLSIAIQADCSVRNATCLLLLQFTWDLLRPMPTTTPTNTPISVDRSNTHDSADECRGALIQLLFQHSHPILSRPTVPNI